jgi:hypothetical protein
LSRIWSNTDFLSGLLFMVLGGGFVFLSRNYEFGAAARMGPGYFPTILGLGVVLVGAALAAKAIMQRFDPAQNVAAFRVRPTLFVLGAMLAFALLLRPLGLVLSAVAVIVVASLAEPDRRWREVLLLACGIALFCAIVFVQFLRVPLPLWPGLL